MTAQSRGSTPGLRRWIAVVAVVVTVSLVAGSVWAIWFSSLLAVRQARVLGVDGAAADRVLVTAAIELGRPMALVDTDAAAERVSQIPWVNEVEVRRGWPHEVVIAIDQRAPVARLVGTTQGVDGDGVAFDPPGRLVDGLPMVRATGDGLVAAMAVLTGLPDDLRQRVRVLTATTRDDVSFILRNGTTVRWGSAERGELKAEVVTALLPRRARMIDVSAPELPTTFAERPKRNKA